MKNALTLRESVAADSAAIESLYPDAFPDEDLLPLVRALLGDSATATSLVALVDGEITGHALFTHCGIADSAARVALLGPVAVAPAWQRRGVGSALVRGGLDRIKEAGTNVVCVLGDPGYYGRFGFEADGLIEPPYALPGEYEGAWQSIRLDDAATHCAGTLTVPAPWQKAVLWS